MVTMFQCILGIINEANSLEACAVVSSMRTQRNTYIQQRAYRCRSMLLVFSHHHARYPSNNENNTKYLPFPSLPHFFFLVFVLCWHILCICMMSAHPSNNRPWIEWISLHVSRKVVPLCGPTHTLGCAVCTQTTPRRQLRCLTHIFITYHILLLCRWMINILESTPLLFDFVAVLYRFWSSLNKWWFFSGISCNVITASKRKRESREQSRALILFSFGNSECGTRSSKADIFNNLHWK